jgi:hypothetical protein
MGMVGFARTIPRARVVIDAVRAVAPPLGLLHRLEQLDCPRRDLQGGPPGDRDAPGIVVGDRSGQHLNDQGWGLRGLRLLGPWRRRRLGGPAKWLAQERQLSDRRQATARRHQRPQRPAPQAWSVSGPQSPKHGSVKWL